MALEGLKVSAQLIFTLVPPRICGRFQSRVCVQNSLELMSLQDKPRMPGDRVIEKSGPTGDEEPPLKDHLGREVDEYFLWGGDTRGRSLTT